MRFLSFLLIVGIFLGSVMMPSVQAQQVMPQEHFSHCGDAEGGSEQQSPEMQMRCMNACSAVNVDAARLPLRLALRPEHAPVPALSSPDGIHPHCDTPPPRLF